jgi:type I restriction enzyme, S subunit
MNMSNTWPDVALGEIAKPVMRPLRVVPGESYRTIGVKWWGEGAYERNTIDGSSTAAKTLSVVRRGDLIINKIWVRHGSIAIATAAVDGCAASGEFPTFELDLRRVAPNWIHWQTKTPSFWAKCDALLRGTSGKNRIKPESFLTVRIPLPPLEEQQRVIGDIENVAAHISDIGCIRTEIDSDINALLLSSYHQIADGAPQRPMAEVAPLNRRPVVVNPKDEYPQVSARSFGKGTFHKPPLKGSEITWQKPFLIKGGDILLSNIKAWEGAIAVARPNDDGRYGSHRYLTCVPSSGVATARFVCFHLLTPQGLDQVGEASPGSADRNRTLSTTALARIPIPVPSYEQQLWFDDLCKEIDSLKTLQSETAEDIDAFLPSILSKAFAGEL